MRRSRPRGQEPSCFWFQSSEMLHTLKFPAYVPRAGLEPRGSQPGEREAVSQLLERECITRINSLQLTAHLIQTRPKSPPPHRHYLSSITAAFCFRLIVLSSILLLRITQVTGPTCSHFYTCTTIFIPS